MNGTNTKKLDALRRKMRRAELPLKRTAKHLVFGEGDESAAVMFIGEAPGRKEDESGRPFAGAAGRELDRLLDAAGFRREDVYVTSILKYRPPKNRNPKKKEIAAHTPFLIEQILLISPEILVPLGNFAMRFILSHDEHKEREGLPSISRCHGHLYTIEIKGRSFQVMPAYHPAAILYNRQLTDIAKADFKKLRKGTLSKRKVFP